jgi:hypothetical protein
MNPGFYLFLGDVMKKRAWIVPILAVTGLGMCTFLRADDTLPPITDQVPKDIDTMNGYVWYIEHYTEIAKDPDAAGIVAVMRATELLKDRGVEVQAEFLEKMLNTTRSRAVQRAIQLQLADMLKTSQPDKAMEELQQIITEQPQ